jgi:hypothetical protein
MGRTIGILAGVMLCCGIVQDVRAQGITIDTSEVRILLGVGQTMPQMTDTLTRSANIGAPGASSWDFSKLNTTTTTHLISTLPSTTTYAADFPAATHAMHDTAFNYAFYSAMFGDIRLKGTGYLYYTLANNKLDNAGFKGSGNAFINGSPYPAQGAWLNSPAATELAFPVQMGKTWSANYTESISGSVFALGGNIPFGPVLNVHAVTYVVDAYGSMDMPDGITRDVLRIKKTDHYVNGTVPGTRVGYILRARDGASVQFNVSDTNAVSGTVGINNVIWSPGLPDLQLPIVLSAFSAQRAEDGVVVISWATASETNNLGFYLQRRRTGEEGFADVAGGFIPGHGTTLQPQAYTFTDDPGTEGAWWYRLKQVDLDGAVRYSDPVRLEGVTGVAGTVPATTYLAQNYPNPFNPSTTIGFGTTERGIVSLRVYNALGQEVALLQNGELEAGVHTVSFDAHTMPSGMYWYVLQAGSFRSTKQLVLVR